ncbi:hypothetical protein [Methanocalculus sp.]|uniref:hypothetical protein n=1 Tax=Methanocalculus sp. TaxID=2004547 RepID=UPI0026087EED|nr:hypothetical protein [Methanocalculus sp.]MDG6250358.1 hypothetical protein [Methanocalculus sp.]
MKIQEYKRTCNNCGKVWHSLVERENQIMTSMKFDAASGCLSACYNHSASAQRSHNFDTAMDTLEKIRACPNCGSKNYVEEIIEYEK